MGEVALNFTSFSLFMLITIMALYVLSSPLDVLASPPIDRQEIPNFNGWVQIPLPQFSDIIIHDGRKLYFNTATDISQCKSGGLLNILPNLTSVSYFSNGKRLDNTFWLSRPPLYIPPTQFLNTSKIHQVYLRIDVGSSKNTTFSQLIADERDFINKEYIDVKIVNKSSTISLNNNPAYKVAFTGRLNYSNFGHPTITATDIVVKAKNEKVYRIRYVAEPTEFLDVEHL